MFRDLIEKLYFKYCLLTKINDVDDFSVDEELLILEEAGKSESILALLKFYLKRDKDRYFVAENDEKRNLIKGQLLRTLYLYKQMRKKGKNEMDKNIPIKKQDKVTLNSIIGGRYGG